LERSVPEWTVHQQGPPGILPVGPDVLLDEAMSRSYKIALILKSRSSLPIYRDLAKLSDRELDEQVLALIRRMRTNESATIARMVQRNPTFSLN
jgi:hypothetical protein